MHGRKLLLTATAAAIAIGALAACSAEKTPTDPSGAPVTPNPNTSGPIRYLSGSGQFAAAGSVLDSAFVVRIFDAAGAPVSGGTVGFTVVTGGGRLSSPTVTSLADGSARATFTVDTVAGPTLVRASYGGAQVEFTVRSAAGPAARLTISGNLQRDTVTKQLRDTLVATVTDSYGNPVSSSTVNFRVLTGGGTITTISAVTDTLGRARARWTLGAAAGQQTAQVTGTGLPAQTFSATAIAGRALLLRIVSGNNQAALVNESLDSLLVVQVEDANGNIVAGDSVVWAAQGDGRAYPTSLVTDANGLAKATWQLGSTIGGQQLTVSINGRPATFTASATITYSTVDAGGFNACAITPSRQAFCWGYNGDGQLGTGSYAYSSVPAPVGLQQAKWRQLSGGKYHTCGITLSGIAYCWGANVDGRLGTGNLTPATTPQQVATSTTFSQVSAGLVHSCGLEVISGYAYCWGFNQHAEVGAQVPPADSIVVTKPRPVSSQSFSTLSVGGQHSCAIEKNTSQAWCWGNNNFGQIGNPTAVGSTQNYYRLITTRGDTIDYSAPVMVQTAQTFGAISAGYTNSCALTASGQAFCWGDNRTGQLGNGTTTGAQTPVAVSGGRSFAQISSGATHSCAVTSAGAAYCWGDNQFGQLGTGSTGGTQLAPVAVAGGLTFTSISAGETMTCGLTPGVSVGGVMGGGAVYCWGRNAYGGLGDESNRDSAVPVKGAYQP